MDTPGDKILIQLVRDIAELKALMTGYADIELRVRELEKARWKSAWLTGVLSSAITASVVALIVRLVTP